VGFCEGVGVGKILGEESVGVKLGCEEIGFGEGCGVGHGLGEGDGSDDVGEGDGSDDVGEGEGLEVGAIEGTQVVGTRDGSDGTYDGDEGSIDGRLEGVTHSKIISCILDSRLFSLSRSHTTSVHYF